MSIEWLSTKINPPLPDKEIVAKNPLKPVGFKSAVRQCKIMKFHPDFTEDKIIENMMDEDLTLWSYT